jgi:hypothetical protein
MSTGIDPTALGQWMTDAKLCLDLVKSTVSMIPKGQERQKIDKSLAQAEDALGRADVSLAQQLGYHLCQCTFPPQIMRWRENEKSFRCPREECGRRLPPALDQPKSKVIPAAKRCPICDEGELLVISEMVHPDFGFAGVKVHSMKCAGCGHQTTRDFDPQRGGYG